MSAETDLIKLYSGRILSLAASIPRTGRLPQPDATVTKRSPLCGSTVTVDVRMRDGRVSDYAQDVKACALGQAAAAVVGEVAPGRTAEDLRAAASELRAMLKDGGPVPGAPWSAFEVLEPARDYRNRHASILLTIEAAAEAAERASAEARTGA